MFCRLSYLQPKASYLIRDTFSAGLSASAQAAGPGVPVVAGNLSLEGGGWNSESIPGCEVMSRSTREPGVRLTAGSSPSTISVLLHTHFLLHTT